MYFSENKTILRGVRCRAKHAKPWILILGMIFTTTACVKTQNDYIESRVTPGGEQIAMQEEAPATGGPDDGAEASADDANEPIPPCKQLFAMIHESKCETENGLSMMGLVEELNADNATCELENDVSFSYLITSMGQWIDDGTTHRCDIPLQDFYSLHGPEQAAEDCASDLVHRLNMGQPPEDDYSYFDDDCLQAFADKVAADRDLMESLFGQNRARFCGLSQYVGDRFTCYNVITESGPATPHLCRLEAEGYCSEQRFNLCRDGVTVSDSVTGLLWERKHADDESSPHHVDRTYTRWNGTHPNSGTNYDNGTVYTEFLPLLNISHFGGFNDWRLPSISELQSILIGAAVTQSGNHWPHEATYGQNLTNQSTICDSAPCIDPDFAAFAGPTAYPETQGCPDLEDFDAYHDVLESLHYWSQSIRGVTKESHKSRGIAVSFGQPSYVTDGNSYSFRRLLKSFHVRAVRTGTCTQ